MIRCYQGKIVRICLLLGLGLALPSVSFSNVSGRLDDLGDRSLVRVNDFERIQKEKVSARFSVMNTWCSIGHFLLVNHDDFTLQPLPGISSKKSGFGPGGFHHGTISNV